MQEKCNRNMGGVNIGDRFLGVGHFLTELQGVGFLVTKFVAIALTLSGVILLFFLILGGIGIIAGAGSQNPEQIEKGKQMVTAAIMGFVVVFVAYWIVRLLELLTGVTILA